MSNRAYDDIPGTTVFDGKRCREGYHLNMFCMSLMDAANRDAFRAGERAYLDRFALSEEQKRGVLARDWNGLIELGGNIYYLAKLGATDGKSFQFIAAQMTGMSQQDYAEMMLRGGRPIDGNRSRKERQNG